MKKGKTITKVAILLLLLGLLFIWIYLNFVDIKGSYIRDKKSITKIINKKYPNYEISSLELQYSDWYGTLHSAEDDTLEHRATSAEVYVLNSEEELYIYLGKTLIGNWNIIESIPRTGPNVPDEYYYGGGFCSWDYNVETAKITTMCTLYKSENSIIYEYKNNNWMELKDKDYLYLSKTAGYYKISGSDANKIINNNNNIGSE